MPEQPADVPHELPEVTTVRFFSGTMYMYFAYWPIPIPTIPGNAVGLS